LTGEVVTVYFVVVHVPQEPKLVPDNCEHSAGPTRIVLFGTPLNG
jgi:hypothetical protein